MFGGQALYAPSEQAPSEAGATPADALEESSTGSVSHAVSTALHAVHGDGRVARELLNLLLGHCQVFDFAELEQLDKGRYSLKHETLCRKYARVLDATATEHTRAVVSRLVHRYTEDHIAADKAGVALEWSCRPQEGPAEQSRAAHDGWLRQLFPDAPWRHPHRHGAAALTGAMSGAAGSGGALGASAAPLRLQDGAGSEDQQRSKMAYRDRVVELATKALDEGSAPPGAAQLLPDIQAKLEARRRRGGGSRWGNTAGVGRAAGVAAAFSAKGKAAAAAAAASPADLPTPVKNQMAFTPTKAATAGEVKVQAARAAARRTVNVSMYGEDLIVDTPDFLRNV